MPPKKKHPGTIEQRGDSFRVIIYSDGKRHTHTLRGGTREQAEPYARDRYAELERERERRALGLPGSMPMSALIDKYDREKVSLLSPASQVSYRGTLGRFRAHVVSRLGDPAADTIRRGHIRDFLNWRRTHRVGGGRPLSGRTLQRERIVLQAVFAFAQELELRDDNPVTYVELPKVDARDPVLLDDAQYEALLRECEHDPMLHMYVLLLGETGARCDSEALQVRWEDADLEAGFPVHPQRPRRPQDQERQGTVDPADPTAARGAASAFRHLQAGHLRRYSLPLRLPPHARPPGGHGRAADRGFPARLHERGATGGPPAGPTPA